MRSLFSTSLIITTIMTSLCLLFAFPHSAKAEKDNDDKNIQTIINLAATERLVLGQDLLQASLRIELDGTSPAAVQKKINTAMQSALKQAKEKPEIKTSTGSYYVYEYTPQPTTPEEIKKFNSKNQQKLWRGVQTIELQSKSSDILLELAGSIQEMGFAMNGLNYTLSPEKAESVRDELMTKALKRLKERASIAAKALDKTGFEMLEVNIDSNASFPQPMMMKTAHMEMAMADAAGGAPPPTAEAGETDITLTVTARILLKP